jgi:hypothetical protein
MVCMQLNGNCSMRDYDAAFSVSRDDGLLKEENYYPLRGIE